MKHIALPFLLALMVASAGCVPARYTDRPGIFGTVVNARTGAPVASARVTVQTGREPASDTTGARGTYRIPAKTHWGLYLFGDYYAPPAKLSVERSGYRPWRTDFPYAVLGGNFLDKNGRTIRLEPDSR